MSSEPQQDRTLGQLVASATEDVSTLVRGEIALAKAEIGAQVKKAGIGGVFLAAAAVVLFYSVYFLFTTIAEALQALGLPRWLSFLIVFVVMLLVAGVFALIGVRKMKTVEPKPEKTIENAERTVDGLKAAVANPGSARPAPRPTFADRPLGSPASGASTPATSPVTTSSTRDA